MDITRDIQTLSEFKKNASKFVKQVHETQQSIVLTVNGKAALVIQDPKSYQKLIDSREYSETVQLLRKRAADIENAEKWPTHKEVFDQVRGKYNIERD